VRFSLCCDLHHFMQLQPSNSLRYTKETFVSIPNFHLQFQNYKHKTNPEIRSISTQNYTKPNENFQDFLVEMLSRMFSNYWNKSSTQATVLILLRCITGHLNLQLSKPSLKKVADNQTTIYFITYLKHAIKLHLTEWNSCSELPFFWAYSFILSHNHVSLVV
jgi:hypothetical protein